MSDDACPECNATGGWNGVCCAECGWGREPIGREGGFPTARHDQPTSSVGRRLRAFAQSERSRCRRLLALGALIVAIGSLILLREYGVLMTPAEKAERYRKTVSSFARDQKSVDPGALRSALRGLGKLGPEGKESIPALIEILKGVTAVDPECKSDLAQDLRQALKNIGLPAVPHLIASFSAPYSELDEYVLLIEPEELERYEAQRDAFHSAVQAILVEIGQPAVPELVKGLDDFYGEEKTVAVRLDRWNRQFYAARTLSEIGVPALPAICQALRSDSRTVRRRAAEALDYSLAVSAPSELRGELLQLKSHDDEVVRAAAEEALAELEFFP